jgi:hypothetical protein
MNLIGTTKNGGKIVQMTGDEYRTFIDAQRSMRGLVLADIWALGPNEDITVGMEQLFQAFRAFITAKFKVNELQRLADDLTKIIGVRPPPKKDAKETR